MAGNMSRLTAQILRQASFALADAAGTGPLHARTACLPALRAFTSTAAAAPAAAAPARLSAAWALRRSFPSVVAAWPPQRRSASDAAAPPGGDASKPPGWISGWVKSKIPTALGGTREEISALENLTLDDYAESLKQARRMGSLTGFASGTGAAASPEAQGTLRLFESIIAGMSPAEKADLAAFGAEGRRRVAAEAGCTTAQVDDCMARFLWMKKMTAKMAVLRREGKPMPRSIDEVEAMLGSWRQFKTEHGGSGGAGGGGGAVEGGGGGIEVPMDAKGPKGQPCPLAGTAVGRNTKCPATRKAYKACCGRAKR